MALQHRLQHRRALALTTLTALAVLAAGGCGEQTDDSSAADSPSAPAGEESESPGKEHTPGDSGGTDSGDAAGGSESGSGDDAQNGAEDGGEEEGTTPSDWCTGDRVSAEVTVLDSGAGQRHGALVLTNSSDAACRTQGWPGLELTGADGSALPTTTVRDESQESEPLTLQPGESAWSQLHWTIVAGEDDPADGTCGPEPAGLSVIPPDAYDATVAEWDLGPVCGQGTIEALPLAPGTGPGA
ncbi:DUF4232 domain-containing protein [Streptomyces sp. RFCAC02]|uniref:DUF4232 domain-containing protein n=1 Tax=Streptomyces sp. RFCAC02 TaxID=2499143 RepID=UPI0010211BD7|nr:DUF4232 domain-containing protein [Streptomyces sp. RFCAC02]